MSKISFPQGWLHIMIVRMYDSSTLGAREASLTWECVCGWTRIYHMQSLFYLHGLAMTTPPSNDGLFYVWLIWSSNFGGGWGWLCTVNSYCGMNKSNRTENISNERNLPTVKQCLHQIYLSICLQTFLYSNTSVFKIKGKLNYHWLNNVCKTALATLRLVINLVY